MPTKQRTRRRGLSRDGGLRKHRSLKRATRRLQRQRGGATPFDLNNWTAAVREDMKTIDTVSTIADLAKPTLVIPADAADREFLEAAARVRAALILVVNQIKDEIINYDGPIATVFANFCMQTADEEIAYLNTIENRLRGSDTSVTICDVTSYPLYIWYVAANTSPDIPVSVDFGVEDTVRVALSEGSTS